MTLRTDLDEVPRNSKIILDKTRMNQQQNRQKNYKFCEVLM